MRTFDITIKIAVMLLASSFIFLPSSFAEVTSQDIEESLPKNLEHPYLFFSEYEKPAILERIKNDPECKAIMDRLLAETNRLMFTPVVSQIPAESKNTRFSGPGEFEKYYYNYRKWVLQLAFVYQMTGDEKYARKSFEFANVLCDLHTWVIRAHQFPVIYSRVMPWNVPDDQAVFSFDIRAGSMSRILGTVYDWIYPALDKRQRNRIRGALLEKGIIPVRGNWDYHWWAHAYRCNWIGRCADGVGIASLALLTEDPQLTDVAAEAFNRLNKFYNEIGIDGGWQEGAGYWYGLLHCIYFGDALKRLSDGKYNLFENPKFKKNSIKHPLHCYIPPNGMVDFCDSHFQIYTPGRSHSYNKVAEETGSKEAAWFRENICGAGDDIFDIIWPRSSIKSVLPDEPSKHFRTIDWVVMRSDFTNTENVVVACKAGMNDDPHHGHLDIGQFAVYWRGQGYISDLGAATYDEQYFDQIRWNYTHASSKGHNVVFVNGELQLPGKLRGKPVDERIGGKVLEFRAGKDRDYTLMDPTNAYPKKELKGWRRHIILEKPYITVVVDEVNAKKGAEIEARFHSQCEANNQEDYVLLNGRDGVMALIPVIDGDFIIRSGKHMDLPVRSDAQLKMVPYFGTVVKAKENTTVLVTIILPVVDDNEASEIVSSVYRSVDRFGKMTLSFEKAEKKYNYRFKKENNEFVLE